MSSARPLSVAALLFGSGLSALAYQIAWERQFRLIFGSSTAAAAAVLAIFVGGLGAGGLLLGRRADAHPEPLRLYAKLELGIAIFAALTPLLFGPVRAIYLRLQGTVGLGIAAGTALRIGLAALVLAAPTVLMGGTLPAAARSVQSDADPERRAVGLLYGANTLGAVTGCALVTFVLLERLGTRGALWSACALNAAIALAAWQMNRKKGNQEDSNPPPISSSSLLPVDPPAPLVPPRFVYAAAAIVGFAFFAMELVWYRMLGPLLGGSVFTFGLILAVALLGIGAGGLAYARARRTATLRGFALTCALEAAGVALPLALGDRVALLALALRPEGAGSLGALLPGWAVIAALVVLPPALVAGAQYPLLIALLGAGRRGVGAQIGAAAACNTAGSMLGALAVGFALLPRLGAPGCWRAVVVLLAALGIAALALAPRPAAREASEPAWLRGPLTALRPIARRLAPLVPAALALACLAATGPTAAWRHGSIGAGRVDRAILQSPGAFHRWREETRRGIVWETEGVESSVAIDGLDGLAFVVNGKVDGNARDDAPTQVMGGVLGALLHPRPRSAMVIGLGTGSTAGWLAAVPSIERVDVAELEPAMVEVARACAAVNHDVLASPKLRLLLGDARETLLTVPARYDVIFSEPSNPYRAGIASLFTREYYEAVRDRLEEGGLFLQWVQLYEIDRGTVETIYATLGAVFPEVESWRLGAHDLVLVAAMHPTVRDAPALRARVAEEPYRAAIAAAWRAEGLEGVLAHHVARPALARRMGEGAPVNTDDRNRIEFAFARNLGNFADLATLLDQARGRGEVLPELARSDVDPALVEEERILALAGEGIEPDIPEGLPVDQELRAVAVVNYVSGNLSGALAKWRFQAREPVGPTEVGLVAEGLADEGSDDALPAIERLRAISPLEADAALARLRFQQGKLPEATARLAGVFEGMRRDPWPSQPAMRRALELADTIAARDLAASLRLLAALREPFAVNALDASRRLTSAWIAQRITGGDPCAVAWRALEPHVPWERESLEARLDCYRRTHDPRREAAMRDFADFEACEGKRGWLLCW